MKSFLKSRVRIVKQLLSNDNDCGMGYGECILILTAVLSSCAANRWPGGGIDRKRFVELLVKCSDAHFHCDFISVAGLLSSGKIYESDTPWGESMNHLRIFIDDEVDLSLDNANVKYPSISVLELKKYSYASLIYTWLRCPYSHEYCNTDNTCHMPATKVDARISYSNRLQNSGEISRITIFHLDYLINLADFHAEHFKENQLPPAQWWLDIG